ncbi:unnamed protein product [Ambrosiozyma monospora]|uniref:indole-3-glycerol-phosphate synthase n=1 Tax=Ambrosiozyma monospora TaxID=43982 RepID=A0A9W7DI55_AMBMO|nr:unnamed protein product [Ambrosiozyma monospora]
MLEFEQLLQLFKYAKSLGMEPLVEVNNSEELQKAVKIGSKVIGVNNRNLHDFNVDLNTTSKLNELVPKDQGIILLALSGISSKEDVKTYKDSGVYGFLIGEALMRKGEKVGEFIDELLSV